MCDCGCNTCETKGPLLTEGKVKSLLSEGLQYHIDKKIPLFETVYRIGSDKHLSLIKEARKMYSRNVIDLCEEDEALIKTHLGEFALYEGESVPLDLPMLNESDSNYPDFDLNKNIRYQDTVITNGMWRYTGRESGGAGVYRNLNNDQFLAFDRNDFDIFRKNLSSHFDFSESLNENEGKAIITFKNDYEVKMNTGEGYDDDFEYFEAGEREQVYILDKNDKRTHVEFGDGTNAFIPSDIISVQEKSLNESYYTAIANLGDKKTKENLDSFEEVQDFMDKMVKQNAISVDVTKFDKDKKQTIKYNWTGDKWEQTSKSDINESELEEAEFKGKDVPLNKPKRGGSKAYYVYVRDPKTKKIKKVSFGSGGLRAKIKNKEARNAFAARHNCKDKKDRTKAGYWSCNLPRYAPALGLGAKMNTFW